MKLTDDEINKSLTTLNKNWKVEGNSISKVFECVDFISAISFVNKVAELSEKANHHPDINISYNKVTITLSTHSEGGVTEKDIDLAKSIDSIG